MRTRFVFRRKGFLAVLAVAVSVAVALPLLLFPVGIGREDPSDILIGKAYAKVYPFDPSQKDVLIEDYALLSGVPSEGEEGEETPLENESGADPLSGLIVIGEGQTVSASYYDDTAPVSQEEYQSINTAVIVPYADSDEIPVEILDPETFTYVDRLNYIQTNATIIKEEPFMSAVTVASINKAESVTRLSDGDSWSKIRTEDGTEGYVPTYCLSETMVFIAIDRTVWVKSSDGLILREGPSSESAPIKTLPKDTRLSCSDIADKWYKVTTSDGLQGYVAIAFTTQTPPPTPTPVPTQAPRRTNSSGSGGGGSTSTGNVASLPSITGVNGSSIVSVCESMLGVPYVWAGASKSGVDCSGLVVYAYRQVGIELPHLANSLKSVGVSVSRSDLVPGDIVTWAINGGTYADHTGIYIGGGQVIHASASKQEVIYGSLDMGTIVGLRRVIQ